MSKGTIVFYFLMILGCSLSPLYRQETSDFVIFEDQIEALANEWVKDTWGKITSMGEYLKEKLLEEEDVKPISTFEQNKRFFTYGFGFGYNAIGSFEKSYQFLRYKTYQTATLFAALICVFLLLQLLAIFIKKLNFLLPFLALLCILSILLFLGYSVDDSSIKIVYGGAFIPLLFQLIMMVRKPIKS
jgi:hypothetical protein